MGRQIRRTTRTGRAETTKRNRSAATRIRYRLRVAHCRLQSLSLPSSRLSDVTSTWLLSSRKARPSSVYTDSSSQIGTNTALAPPNVEAASRPMGVRFGRKLILTPHQQNRPASASMPVRRSAAPSPTSAMFRIQTKCRKRQSWRHKRARYTNRLDFSGSG